MKAVVLAAGEGRRMRPLTFVRPKVMLPIAGKPIIEHLLIELKKAGISDFIIVVGYHDETIRDYFSDGSVWGLNIQYVTQRQQLGTANALMKVEDLVEDTFLMLNGDTIVDAGDIRQLIGTGAGRGITMGVIEVDNPEEYGVVETEGERVTRITEKTPEPHSKLVNAGVYLLNRHVFGALKETGLSKRGEFELTDSLQLLIDSGETVRWSRIKNWIDVSYPWDLLRANEFMMSCIDINKDKDTYPVIEGNLEEGVTLKGKVAIGSDTIIKAGTYIEGPVIIGANCEIGPNCYIRASTAIGDNCRIGNAVEIKNSIIMHDTKIPHLSYVGDSVIASHCNIGAGTKIANLRFDDATIKVAGRDTGRRKFGAILGDGVKTGINASIDAGTIIGNNTQIGPGAFVYGYIKEKSRIF